MALPEMLVAERERVVKQKLKVGDDVWLRQRRLCLPPLCNFEPNVVLKLNYPKWSSIYDSLISGSLKSVVSDKDDGDNYFDAIMVFGFSVKHSYGLLGNCLERFELVYGSECGGGVNCNPLGGDVGYIAPLFRELSEQYISLMFLVVDVDELTDFRTSWDIKVTPTFFFLRDG
ncbi:hypothetical protein ACLB2K_040851 [Fragaria x ananassa]